MSSGSSASMQAYSITENGLRVTFPIGVKPVVMVPCYALDENNALWQWRLDSTAIHPNDSHKGVWSFEPLLVQGIPPLRSIESYQSRYFSQFIAIDIDGCIWMKGINGYGLILDGDPLRYQIARVANRIHFFAVYGMQKIPSLSEISSVHFGDSGIYFNSVNGGTLYRIDLCNTGPGCDIDLSDTCHLLERLEGYFFSKEEYPSIDEWLLHLPEAYSQEHNLSWIDYWSNENKQIVLDEIGTVYSGACSLLTTELEVVEGLPKIMRIQRDGSLIDEFGKIHWIAGIPE